MHIKTYKARGIIYYRGNDDLLGKINLKVGTRNGYESRRDGEEKGGGGAGEFEPRLDESQLTKQLTADRRAKQTSGVSRKSVFLSLCML